MTTRVLIVDDQAVVRAGFRTILGTEPDLEVVGEAANGLDAVAAARRLQPDVVLMDIRMPGVDGLEAARRLAADASCPARVLILTTFDLDEYVFTALQAGACGFLLKDATPDELVNAVRVVAAGDSLLAPAVTGRLIQEFARTWRPARHRPELDRLTARELEVLALLARGKTDKEIAEALFLSPRTVQHHVAGALAKLGAGNRTAAVAAAQAQGLFSPSPRQ